MMTRRSAACSSKSRRTTPPHQALQVLGFAQIAERKGYYARPDGQPATALVMARDLV